MVKPTQRHSERVATTPVAGGQPTLDAAPRGGGAAERTADSFAATGRRMATAAERSGYDHPIDASELPDPGTTGTAVMTLNLANGAGERYRTPENRAAQAKLIRDAGASVVGFQEVDVGVNRTANVNTALELTRLINPAFDLFASGAVVPRRDLSGPRDGTGILAGADGTTVYQTAQGALVTGESFSGDDRGGGVAGDPGADATYGNALYLAAPNRLVEAYTVALPHSATTNIPAPASVAELEALASGPLDAQERNALGERNEAVRRGARIEPRTALVARIAGPDGTERTVINVHLAAGSDQEAVRQKQLEYVAQLVRAESAGPPAREVVLMGDFNDSVAEVTRGLGDAGLRRVVGGRADSFANIDQVWVSAASKADTSAQVKTRGTSDHPHAGYTVLR